MEQMSEVPDPVATASEQAAHRARRRRSFLIIGLGLACLILVTGLGTFVTNYIPTMPTPATQITEIGPYTVILRVSLNPPSTSQPATLTVTVQQKSSHQPVNGARVVIDGTMANMDMDTSALTAIPQGAGVYVARVPFSMSGSWQIQVTISQPAQPAMNAIFTVTAR